MIQLLRGISTDLLTLSTPPENGRLIYESDTNKLKVGNGSSTYSDLPYVNSCSYQYLKGSSINPKLVKFIVR